MLDFDYKGKTSLSGKTKNPKATYLSCHNGLSVRSKHLYNHFSLQFILPIYPFGLAMLKYLCQLTNFKLISIGS